MGKACQQAVILAAGEGKRLQPLTSAVPKCLVPVNGRPMLDRLFEALELAGVVDVTVVTGHLADTLRHHISTLAPHVRVRYVHNEAYDRTNNVYSLWLARHALTAPFLLAESDLVIEKTALREMAEPDRIAVARWEPGMDGTVIQLRDGNWVDRLILKKDQAGTNLRSTWKTMNFYSFSAATWERYERALDTTVRSNSVDGYYEAVLGELVNAGAVSLTAVDFSGSRWMEVDNLNDLDRAEALFSEELELPAGHD